MTHGTLGGTALLDDGTGGSSLLEEDDGTGGMALLEDGTGGTGLLDDDGTVGYSAAMGPRCSTMMEPGWILAAGRRTTGAAR